MQPQGSDANCPEVELGLASTGNSLFNTGILARKVFAWLRVTCFVDSSNPPVLVLDEVGNYSATSGRDQGLSAESATNRPIPACRLSMRRFENAIQAVLAIAVNSVYASGHVPDGHCYALRKCRQTNPGATPG